ncbi:putative secreted beta-lactamase [Xylariaceae sp. FL1651]|nr:putative secreted beta-lactamase [Xylariaceae sp. FL1651]
MKLLASIAFALCLHLSAAQGKQRICPLQGQQFPAPTGLPSEALFHNATKSIEHIIRGNLTLAPYNDTTFSLGMFSTTHDELIYQFHHTDAAVATSGNGTNEVDADSIYRIASITKILTIYQWLIKDGDRRFNDPISDFIPQLTQFEKKQDYYPAPSWSEITVNDLAMYLAGVARDYGLNDVAIKGYVTSLLPTMAADDLPDNPANGIDVPASDDPTCGYFKANLTYDPCSQDIYIKQIANLASSFVPGYTPLYSNANFALLGIALSNMLGISEEEIFSSSIAKPLGLNGTTIGNPRSVTNSSVIPGGDLTATGWANALGPLNGAAGAFSTTNDLATIGKSILNSTLMSQAVTRRWFSTTSFVETIDQAVGRGWEIFRIRNDNHSINLYTKSGNWGVYNSVIFLIPDYEFGFSLLTASSTAGGALAESLPNLIINTIVPALEAIAKQQAYKNFGGHYASNATNTSITVTTDDWPALKVTEYVAEGVDLLDSVFALFGDNIDFRLVPNHLYHNNHVGFTGLYQPPTTIPPKDEFYWPCQAWLDIDDFTYASVPLGSMMFEIDDSGMASSVRLNALREKLYKE